MSGFSSNYGGGDSYGGSYRDQRDYSNQRYSRDYGSSSRDYRDTRGDYRDTRDYRDQREYDRYNRSADYSQNRYSSDRYDRQDRFEYGRSGDYGGHRQDGSSASSYSILGPPPPIPPSPRHAPKTDRQLFVTNVSVYAAVRACVHMCVCMWDCTEKCENYEHVMFVVHETLCCMNTCRVSRGASYLVSLWCLLQLSFRSTWQSLKDHFKRAGRVDHADVLTAADGRPRGCGTVLLSTKADAARAIGEFVMVGLWCGGSYRDQRDYSNQRCSCYYGARLFARLLCWWGVNEKGFDVCLCVVNTYACVYVRT